jgi:hypothetical protein
MKDEGDGTPVAAVSGSQGVQVGNGNTQNNSWTRPEDAVHQESSVHQESTAGRDSYSAARDIHTYHVHQETRRPLHGRIGGCRQRQCYERRRSL